MNLQQLYWPFQVQQPFFDMLGNKIATLVDGWQEAGRHNYELRISNYELGAGMYMVRMMSGEGVVSEKVVFVE